MPKISELWGKGVRGEHGRIRTSCLIVGSGPSAGLCELEEMSKHHDYTIVLNQAWRLFPEDGLFFDMLLTIHPHELEVVPIGPQSFCDTHGCIIATKRKGKTGWASELTPEAYRDVYVFTNNRDVHDFTNVKKASDEVYTGRGIQATAMSIAAHMEFKQLYLVGCDMCDLLGSHHATKGHHVRTHGLRASDIYREYYECSAAVRQIIRNEFGVRVYTITPFLGLDNPEEDYHRQGGISEFAAPQDTSAYTREKDAFL